MLTWALAYLHRDAVSFAPILFIVSMGCDVAIFALLAEVLKWR
jgi:hypothetical protein